MISPCSWNTPSGYPSYKEGLHPGLPGQRHCPQSRVNQDRPTTSRHLRYSGRISSTCGALPPGSFLSTSVTSAWVMDESTSEPSASASSMEDVSVGLRRSSKYSFHRPTISPVEVSSFPPPLKTVLVGHRFPLLRCCMVCQNFFDANQ